MSQTLPPVDVRLMNATASMVFFSLFLLAAAAGVTWLLRNPAFAITQVVVHGNVQHSSAISVRANVLPQLRGNLFTLDLAHARQAFEQLPWVRSAELRRGFPNTLQVRLEEHLPVALWGDAEGSAMLNSFGEVFEANRGEVADAQLPRLAGPAEQSQQVLAMYQFLMRQWQAGMVPRNLADAGQLHPSALYLTPRGNWQLFLANGAHLELGAGQPQQVGQRLSDFFETLPQALDPLGVRPSALEYADLRHRNGYAIRLRGVVTEQEHTPARARG